VLDTPSLWGLVRSRAYGSNPKERVVVLLGMSRMHLDVDRRVFAREAPDHTVIQLAIPGTNPMPVLRDFAADTRFDQTLVVSLQAAWLMSGDTSAADYVRYYHENGRRLNSRMNSSIESWLQSVSVLRSGVLSPGTTLAGLIAGEGWPRPSYIRMYRDRSREADYTMVDLEALQQERLLRNENVVLGRWADSPPSREEFAQRVSELVELVGRIERRGGKVAVVRLPTSGAIWDREQRIFPREEFWDLLDQEAAFPTVHFQDFAALRGFNLPDMSHLDYRDAPAFTRALVGVLRDQGVLD
jgi:hypothetical protein